MAFWFKKKKITGIGIEYRWVMEGGMGSVESYYAEAPFEIGTHVLDYEPSPDNPMFRRTKTGEKLDTLVIESKDSLSYGGKKYNLKDKIFTKGNGFGGLVALENGTEVPLYIHLIWEK